MNEEEKYKHLTQLMGYSLAKRYVIAKLEHWKSDEFIAVRTETKEYWENVLSYF